MKRTFYLSYLLKLLQHKDAQLRSSFLARGKKRSLLHAPPPPPSGGFLLWLLFVEKMQLTIAISLPRLGLVVAHWPPIPPRLHHPKPHCIHFFIFYLMFSSSPPLLRVQQLAGWVCSTLFQHFYFQQNFSPVQSSPVQ